MNMSVVSNASTVARREDRTPRGWVRLAAAFVEALQASGQARARGEMLAHAERCEALQPELAAELRAASARLIAA